MVKSLTPAERELVELATLGLSNQELAHRRRSSESTVANQLSAAYRKLGVASRRELRALLKGSRAAPERLQRRKSSLTPREQAVLACAEGGLSNKLIAHSLDLAVSTVSTLLTRGRRKL